MMLAWAGASAHIPDFFSIDTFGCAALVGGKYQKALEALWGEKSVADSGYWNFKKGVAHFHCKDYRNARACFLFCIRKDAILAPLAFEYLGDVENLEQHPREAAEAYLRAQRDSAIQRDHAAIIRTKLGLLVAENPALVDTVPFLSVWRVETAGIKKEKSPSVYAPLDSLSWCGDLSHADSVLGFFTDSGAAEDPCVALSRIEALHLPDSVFLTKRFFSISKAFQRCKSYDKALVWLEKAMARPDFSEAVSPKTALRHRALLEYYCAHYKQSLLLLTQYKTLYGPLPDVILTMARAYRNLGKDTLSMETYSLFTRLFPYDPLLGGVLWNLALENDQRGNFHKAITLYRKLALMKKNPTRAAEALFRTGLCYYKAQEYESAGSSLTKCLQLYPDAPQYLASMYWRAKALSARNRNENALREFSAVIRAAPTDYYAFRAREALTLSGDTTLIPEFDTVVDGVRCRHWLDSLASGDNDTITREDSCVLQQGKKLAFAGCTAVAQYYLDVLELRYPSNLTLQFDLALMYKIADNPTASFRIGRRLSWKIPQKKRGAMPLDLYILAYPLAYFDAVKQAAAIDTVDPFLVLSVIRQESVFNPLVVSRAGAVGLMQLMPATAATVAADLAQPFAVDSLTRYAINIRFGTHYLKKLLDQFHGNMVQAIAGYNGGPPAIMRWFEKNKSKNFDLFIEDIGYEETRGYVKKVLANFWTYSNLMRKWRP